MRLRREPRTAMHIGLHDSICASPRLVALSLIHDKALLSNGDSARDEREGNPEQCHNGRSQRTFAATQDLEDRQNNNTFFRSHFGASSKNSPHTDKHDGSAAVEFGTKYKSCTLRITICSRHRYERDATTGDGIFGNARLRMRLRPQARLHLEVTIRDSGFVFRIIGSRSRSFLFFKH